MICDSALKNTKIKGKKSLREVPTLPVPFGCCDVSPFPCTESDPPAPQPKCQLVRNKLVFLTSQTAEGGKGVELLKKQTHNFPHWDIEKDMKI